MSTLRACLWREKTIDEMWIEPRSPDLGEMGRVEGIESIGWSSPPDEEWAAGVRRLDMLLPIMNDTLHRRNELLRRSNLRLPGSVPYDNYRPINVPARFDGYTLLDCLCAMHPHISPQQWRSWFRLGHILRDSSPAPMDRVVRGGNQFRHLFPGTVEPDVDTAIEVLWEDDALIAVHKPAPLPIHPCGRFNRNTLTSLLRCLYEPKDLRVVHRLDANTTGLLLLARTRDAATGLRKQFEEGRVRKRYLVRCEGHPPRSNFTCRDPITRNRCAAGSRRIDPEGSPATTVFRLVRRLGDGTSLIEARPLTGRTNQIRIHLWAMRMPVLGDPAYLKDKQTAATQTLGMDQPPMCLHASHLALIHPVSSQPLQLVAPMPAWVSG